jgi:hypothetical protein
MSAAPCSSLQAVGYCSVSAGVGLHLFDRIQKSWRALDCLHWTRSRRKNASCHLIVPAATPWKCLRLFALLDQACSVKMTVCGNGSEHGHGYEA